MSKTQKVLLGLLMIFIVIQFFQPERNQSAQAAPNDLFAHYQAPDSIKALVKSACYDCHSNNTTYPWYSKVQPVAWWLNDHIQEGKKELNFSEFATYAPKKADHKMEEVIEMIDTKEMPLESYTIIHNDARLTDNQRKGLMDWAAEVRKEIQPNIR